MGLELSLDAILVTYMSVKCDLDEGETQNSVLVVCETRMLGGEIPM